MPGIAKAIVFLIVLAIAVPLIDYFLNPELPKEQKVTAKAKIDGKDINFDVSGNVVQHSAIDKIFSFALGFVIALIVLLIL